MLKPGTLVIYPKGKSCFELSIGNTATSFIKIYSHGDRLQIIDVIDEIMNQKNIILL